jgi:hypothetical protein
MLSFKINKCHDLPGFGGGFWPIAPILNGCYRATQFFVLASG